MNNHLLKGNEVAERLNASRSQTFALMRSSPQFDPLVEILRLAYRRGLAICQEQKQSKEQPVTVQAVDGKTKDPKEAIHKKSKGNKRASLPSPSNKRQ